MPPQKPLFKADESSLLPAFKKPYGGRPSPSPRRHHLTPPAAFQGGSQGVFSHVALCFPGRRPASTCISYLLLQRGLLRGQHWVGDVGLLRAGRLVEPRRSLAHGITSRICWLGLPRALRHIGRFGAVPPPVAPIVGVLVAALWRCIAIGRLRGTARRWGIAIVGPMWLWRAILWGAGRAGRRGSVGLAWPEAAVVPGLGAGRLVVWTRLCCPHLDVEGWAAGGGSRSVGGWHWLRL